jgi:acyl-CoA thioester hydrolase
MNNGQRARSRTSTLADFPVQTLETLRYADTDRQGHINNAVFATLVEAGRVSFLYDPTRPLAPPRTQFVIAELTIKFLSELNWPGQVHVGTGVANIGNSSFALDQAIFSGDTCAARATSIIVLIDEATRKSTPLPGHTRTELERLHKAVAE